MPKPEIGQLILAITAAIFFLASVIVSIARTLNRATVFALSGLGVLLTAIALVWHAVQRSSWLPLNDNFDSLLWLALMTAFVSLYLQLRKAVGRVDWALTPIVILLLIAAVVFGTTMPHSYTHSLWINTHLFSVFTGPIALALAAATGVMYLILSARLRNKQSPVDARFGSLERLENLTYLAVTIGFALLTVGLVTGIVRAVEGPSKLGENWFWQPKVLLATSAYVLYALVLHSPINPAFRGRRTAILSIAGFVLLLGTLGVVQAMR